MLNWNKNAEEICRAIESTPSQVKIVLKTRNESEFLEMWIEHHLKIFGSHGIVIFDNMSDDLETLAIYKKYSDKLSIFEFSGMHNFIHDTRIYPELYKALRKSSEYYSFLDTDEFLYWISNNGSIFSDSNIAKFIAQSDESVIPGIWVHNAPGKMNDFLLTFRQNHIASGIKGGKPMVKSTTEISGFSNHNCQISPQHFNNCATANLIVVHRKNLSASQRTNANLQKLRRYNEQTRELENFGLRGTKFEVADVLSIDIQVMPNGNARTYIAEIQHLHSNPYMPQADVPITSLRNGILEFSDHIERQKVLEMLQNPRDLIRSVLQPKC